MAEGADQVCHLGQGGAVGLLQEPMLHLRESLIGRRQVPNRGTRVTGIVRAKISPRNPGQLVGIVEGHQLQLSRRRPRLTGGSVLRNDQRLQLVGVV